MSIRIVYLCEGTSDQEISSHIQQIAANGGVDAIVSSPDFRLLGGRVDRTVRGKLSAVKALGGSYDLVIVHRDADRAGVNARSDEIRDAVLAEMPDTPHVCVIPVTMTEAWLLLDEKTIRQVAENPKGKVSLGLPKPSNVERIADPKAKLKQVLAAASELTGRRLSDFQKRFPQHRKRLLEQLDHNSGISQVPSWCAFKEDLENALQSLQSSRLVANRDQGAGEPDAFV